jgi:hypothetical protein
MRDIGVRLIFYFICTKRYLIVYSPHRTSAPANGCHAMETREVHALHVVGGTWSTSCYRSLNVS